MAKLEDTQTALLLLRHCAGFCKITYSCRTVPPHLQKEALAEYSGQIREGLKEILQNEVDERGWAQAQLGIIGGGLGLRDPMKHAPAAYVASIIGTEGKCKEMDKGYEGKGAREDSRVWQDLKKSVLPEATMEGP